jgi:acetyl-CoA synthetase
MQGSIAENQYNIGHICTGLQCQAGRGDKVAMRWISPQMQIRDYTFSELDRLTARFANVLTGLGLVPGDIFFTFLPKAPEQFVAFLGGLKMQAIVGTLFSNFGEEAVLDRVGDAGAKGIITKKSFLKKISRIRDRLPALRFIIVVDSDEDLAEDILSYSKLMEQASESFEVPQTPAETPSVLHYTSGSTGKPKGVLHAHRSVLQQSFTASSVLGLTPEDIFWCTADQGWVTGTSYGIIGPWSLGVTQIQFGGGYNPAEWFRILQDEKITVWYSAPTALRMLMREEDELYKGFDLSSLRHISSVGEPLNPEVNHWAHRTIGKEVYDTWFQTETGAIMIANRPGVEVRPGSMGKPVDGIEPAIIDDDGTHIQDGRSGNLCVKVGWHSMFQTYLNNPSVYQSRIKEGYYYTGDTAYRDSDGYYWFQGRSDDVINTSGHLISPFEIESALIEVPQVTEAGVIGAPDELVFEKVIAFISLQRGAVYDRELELKIRLHVSNKLSSVATPHEIICIESIPKNKSGKIMRRVLKARYLGTDVGDISTLEED